MLFFLRMMSIPMRARSVGVMPAREATSLNLLRVLSDIRTLRDDKIFSFLNLVCAFIWWRKVSLLSLFGQRYFGDTNRKTPFSLDRHRRAVSHCGARFILEIP